MNATSALRRNDSEATAATVTPFAGAQQQDSMSARVKEAERTMGKAFASILQTEMYAASQINNSLAQTPSSFAHLDMLTGRDEKYTVKDTLNNGDFQDGRE